MVQDVSSNWKCNRAVNCYVCGSILDWIVAANGVYDVMCAVGILFLPNTIFFSKLAQLHPTMFAEAADQNHPILRRALAYWLITYGAVRIAIFVRCDAVDYLGAVSYFVEAAAFAFEDVVHNTTVRQKVAWVSWSSVLLGIWVLLRPLELYSQSPPDVAIEAYLPVIAAVLLVVTASTLWCVWSVQKRHI